MKQPWRLAQGGRIRRDQPLTFRFNGRTLAGYRGDTLASALLANGVRVVARSFKYHRPRGIVGAGAEEPNAIFQVGAGARQVPNLRATQVELVQGLEAATVNCWPSVDFDLSAVYGRFGRLLPAGFYYKTFMWPGALWMWYEKHIRAAAGLGHAPVGPDPDRYDHVHGHCDLLVVGAGPAGLIAALTAARAGARVILADEQAEPGGSLLASNARIDGLDAASWLRRTVVELERAGEVRLLTRSTVYGYHDCNFLTICERRTDHLDDPDRHLSRERIWRVRARQVVLATGAIERPLVFPGNDRPGVMLASAASTYLRRYAVQPGSRALVFTNNDSAYRTVLDFLDHGVPVSAVVDVRRRLDGALADEVRARGVELHAGSVITDVRGNGRIRSVRIDALSDDGRQLGRHLGSLGCDILAVSGGWNPTVHLHAQSGGRPRFDDQRACFVPGPAVQAQRSAGSCAGTFTLHGCLRDGIEVAAASLADCGLTVKAPPVPRVEEPAATAIEPLWIVPGRKPVSRTGKQFVDLQNDTTAADIHLAVREGFRSIEHVKRYTALGFGTDQGKLGNINGMGILAQCLGQEPGATGTTTFRPNYTPVSFGAIAGREIGPLFFDPVRTTPMHDRHVALGAAFEDVGQWKRPWYYPHDRESIDQAVHRECLATRKGIGFMDASTLGKIDIRGADACRFLNLLYTNAWDNLGIGRCRYGLMLGEDGMVMDDGVTSRLGEHHYHMTTTSGGAARVLAWMERWLQTEWPDLEVYLTSVTERWAVIAVAGPNSRRLLEALCPDIDFSPEGFPFMSFQEGTVDQVPVRVFRISFSGELAYEINIPADYGGALWDLVADAGAKYDACPYGTEAMHVLRAEKGFIIVGQDTDGSVTPIDLGMEWIVSRRKDFIGRRSLARPDTRRDHRKQLVGLRTVDPAVVLPEGAQLVNAPSRVRPVPMIGHVTSSYRSAVLGHSIALALIKGGRSRMGATVHAQLLDGRKLPATICEPVFFDPQGERQHA